VSGETAISRSIKAALVSLGCMVIRVQSGMVSKGAHWIHLAQAGTPDLCVMTPDAKTVWCETKTPVGSLSDEQKNWHAEARKRGHRVAVVRSVSEAVEAVTA
jgi:hypothetical protein